MFICNDCMIDGPPEEFKTANVSFDDTASNGGSEADY